MSYAPFDLPVFLQAAHVRATYSVVNLINNDCYDLWLIQLKQRFLIIHLQQRLQISFKTVSFLSIEFDECWSEFQEMF